MNTLTLICGLITALTTCTAFIALAAENALAIGDTAPLFEGTDQDNNSWKLQDHLGNKNVLLYFYPRDNTPGCTLEACSWRDSIEQFNNNNTLVVGVSFDSAESHRKFIQKQNLNFTLLTDSKGKIADLYHVRRGPETDLARRVSFLIAKDGRISHITDTASASTHVTEMKDAISDLDADNP
ncbi:MAG: peroxiredoxin [Verrucomicrobia bacterium]|nr:peroxiredoxin [Verrucomicrobiota bacterium]MCF7708187.1 peroxiredoxin [Verrucomicrobiota bacterium]